MSKTIHTLRLAPVAIAATLAFANPAFAQETVPAAEPAPAPAAAPAAAPTIVLPSFEPAPAPSAAAPSAATASTVAAPAAVTRAATPARATAARTTAARAASSAAAPAAATAAPVAAAPMAAAPAPAAPIAAAPAEPIAPAPAPETTAAAPADSSGTALGIAGLVGILALGGAAVAASRRRSRRTVDEDVYEPELAAEPAETATEAYTPAVAPLAAESIGHEPVVAARSAAPAFAAGVGAGTLALQRVPETAEGRAEMLDRMTKAEPDDANPFRSPKARRRRARLMMQGMIARQDQRGEPARTETRSGPSYDWNSLRPATAPQRELTDA